MELTEYTKQCLAAGYTKDNPPPGARPWNEFYGGWEYSREQINSFVYVTGCGLCVKGNRVISDMGYRGIEWKHENNNPVIGCPYNKVGCELNHPFFADKSLMGYLVECVCHRTEEPWEYDSSVEKVLDENEAMIKKKYEAFTAQKKGRVCTYQSRYDEVSGQWMQWYDPVTICSRQACRYCSILQKELSGKKGNVFYDVKITRNDPSPGLLNRGTITEIIKGVRLFEKNCSMDICEMVVRHFPDKITEKWRMRHHSEVFFSEHFGQRYDFEILNIRAERRESRDLEQDLEDIANGFTITHQSDTVNTIREKKREAKQKRQQDKAKKYKKLIAEHGYSNLPKVEMIRVNKLIGQGLLDPSVKKMKPDEKYEQISLF